MHAGEISMAIIDSGMTLIGGRGRQWLQLWLCYYNATYTMATSKLRYNLIIKSARRCVTVGCVLIIAIFSDN